MGNHADVWRGDGRKRLDDLPARVYERGKYCGSVQPELLRWRDYGRILRGESRRQRKQRLRVRHQRHQHYRAHCLLHLEQHRDLGFIVLLEGIRILMTALDIIEIRTDSTVVPETPIDALGMDSLEFLELLVELNIPVEKSAQMETVADLIREAR